MRYLMLAAAALTLSACASQGAAPAAAKAADAPKKSPQCYSGEDDRFHAVGTSTTIAGVRVTCQSTADGKSAQWMGQSHK